MTSAAEDAGYTCRSCSFSLWLPIARLEISHLGLYDDARFPGRCLLVFDRHVEDFSTIPPEDAARFVGDLQRAARAIETVVKPARLNYALLGNKEPHVHFHLIPRPSDDPVLDQTPWHHPEPVTPLSPSRRNELIEEICEQLGARE